MPVIQLEPITAEAFAPFGQLMPSREPGQPRLDFIDELQNLRGAAKSRLSVAAVMPKTLPITAVEMERHEFSSQAFIPYDCESFLVLVAPHGADDKPDVAGIRAFRVPGHVGINYAANVWHHPLTALDGPARFVVFTFWEGSATDEEFVPLPEPVTIEG